MTVLEPSELPVGGRSGWMGSFFHWPTKTASRRMITLWFGWATLLWIIQVSLAFFGSLSAMIVFSRVMVHSTVVALVAATAFVRPYTFRSLAGPIALYLACSFFVAFLAVIQTALNGSSVSLSVYDIGANLVSYLGYWIWIGVHFFLVSQFTGICVTRHSGDLYEVFSLKKMMVATLLAATAFALQRFVSEQQIWQATNTAKLIRLLSSTLVVIPWCAVLWMQISSRRIALLLIAVTTVAGVGLSETMYAALWSRMELKQTGATFYHMSLWESALSWLMSMLGAWIALRIARVGGYRVMYTSSSLAQATNRQSELL